MAKRKVDISARGKKIHVAEIKTVALVIHRHATDEEHFVYFGIANKPQIYPLGKSKIVYIGQTEKGIDRLASSAAETTKKLKDTFGISSLTYYIIVPGKLIPLKPWKLLETALIDEFLHQYGNVPKANKQGKGYKIGSPAVQRARKHFADERLRNLISHFSNID